MLTFGSKGIDQNSIHSRSVIRLLILGLACVMLCDRANAQSIRTSRDANPKIVRGEFPPDFTLPRLSLTKDANGNPVGMIDETDTIQLSSFRGKKPVCLIMSSYT